MAMPQRDKWVLWGLTPIVEAKGENNADDR